MNPFIRPTRSLLTCKNKSNIFHYVLLGLYNAATTVVCFKNVTSHNCSYCFLAWFSSSLFLSSRGRYCLFQLSLCFETHRQNTSRHQKSSRVLCSNTTLLSQPFLFRLTRLMHPWHFPLLFPHRFSLCWPVSVSTANWTAISRNSKSHI